MPNAELVDLEVASLIDDGLDLLPILTRKTVDPGTFAQLVYRGEQGVEYLWAEVIQREGDTYSGRLDSTPVLPSLAIAEGDAVQFGPQHVRQIYRRQAVGPNPSYEALLADAETLKARKYREPVLRIEEAEIAKRMPESLRGADGAERLAEYLKRNPLCASCEAYGQRVDATTAAYLTGAEGGDGDDNLMPLCRGSAYVLVARANGWPVRGCDVEGYPNDPEHRWNMDAKQ